jgi:hypothetical protein
VKLRVLALLLLVANLVFFAWTQGWLDGVVSVRARGDREPERLAREFQPQRVRVLAPDEAAAAMAASAPVPAATLSCLEAGPYTPAEARAAETLLQAALPAGSWARRSVERPGSWIVYLGRFTTEEALQKKIEELRRLSTSFEELQSPPELAPGLSLGRFDSRPTADKALEQFGQRGVRTARVVALSEPATMTLLRVERADPALALELAALGGEVKGQPLGKAFGPCAK